MTEIKEAEVKEVKEVKEAEAKEAEVEVRKISEEDLQVLKDTKNNTVLQQLNAEKAVAVSKMAQLEEENLIFKIYAKYDLKHGMHRVSNNGEIKEMTAEERMQLQQQIQQAQQAQQER